MYFLINSDIIIECLDCISNEINGGAGIPMASKWWQLEKWQKITFCTIWSLFSYPITLLFLTAFPINNKVNEGTGMQNPRHLVIIITYTAIADPSSSYIQS